MHTNKPPPSVSRAARDRAAHPLLGGFTIEDAPGPGPAAAAAPSRAARRRTALRPRPDPAAHRPSTRRRTEPTAPAAAVGPVSGVQQLLTLAGQDGGAR